MPLTFVARFSIKPDKEEDFLALVPQIEAISGEEPDTLAYKFYRLDEPHRFAVLESFTDEAADLAHQQNPQTAPIIEGMIACMDGTYSREYLHDIA